MAHRITFFKPLHKERTSSGLFAARGSMTVEMALAIPLFLAVICAFVCILEIADIRMNIYMGMWNAARETAQDLVQSPVLSKTKIEKAIVHAVGEDRLDRSMVDKGAGGIDCKDSRLSLHDGMIHIKVSYQIRTPLPKWLAKCVSCTDSLNMKAWTGYRSGIQDGQEETLVFITETGSVYHMDMSCPYLQLSIRPVSAQEVDGFRNDSGGKYYPCSSCTKREIEKGVVYITNTGNRYHISLQCSRLKRKIYTVPLREVAGKGACSKCTK